MKFSTYKNKLSWQNKLYRLVWNISYYIFYRPFITKYFNWWRILVLRVFGAKLGKDVWVASNVKIWAPNNLEMGNKTLIAHSVKCYNPAKIIIHSETVISQYCFLCSASHDISSSQHNLTLSPIEIKDQVWIAADAFIGPGVTINQGAVVGARSAVFKDVQPWTIVSGNPAKFVKKRNISR